ncbi:MAG TPA: hypothetical protein PKO22_09335 [Treponemataceae bacterium]|nr:hypothetical protein [Treponemataceae bacterium]
MSGRIYADSTGLAQDKARILYEYFRKAAKKIVEEETDLEQKIAAAEADELTFEKKSKKAIIVNSAIGAAGVVLIFIFWVIGIAAIAFAGIRFLIGFLKTKKDIAAKRDQIATFRELHANIRRDYTVSKLGVAYVPVATGIPFEGKSILIDHTGTVGERSFTLSTVRSPGELSESIKAVQTMTETIPLVESESDIESVNTADYSTSIQNVSLYDYTGNIDRQVRNMAYLLQDVDKLTVAMPIIPPNSEEARFLETFSTSTPADSAIINVFDTHACDKNIQTFNDLNAMKNMNGGRSGEYAAFFRQLMLNVGQATQYLVSSKQTSSNRLIDSSNAIFSDVLKSSFNHYSPVLEAEEISRIRDLKFDYQQDADNYKPFDLKPSSRVRYDLFSANWIAEDGSRTSMPFGVHQIQEEIIAPIIQNLMAETRIERLKIYNHIKDQKIDYLNQWHRDTEDFYGRNRAEANELINRMRDALAEYMAAFNTFKALQDTQQQMEGEKTLENATVKTSSNSADVVAAFELQANQFRQQQDDFLAFMERLKEDIDRRATEFGHIEFYEASLRDEEAKKAALSQDMAHELDVRRKRLLAAGTQFAAYAKLPPEPSMDESAFENLAINPLQEAMRSLREIDEAASSLIDGEAATTGAARE